MSQYIVHINEKIDELRGQLQDSGQTEALAVADHLESLQGIADQDDLSSEEYFSLIQSSLEELAGIARNACLEICGQFEASGSKSGVL